MNNSNALTISIILFILVVIIGGAFFYLSVMERMTILEKKFGGELSQITRNVVEKTDTFVADSNKSEAKKTSTISASTHVFITSEE